VSAALLDAPQELRAVPLDGDLSLADAAAAARGAARLALGANARRRIEAAHGRLRGAIAENRLIYGITTGFGPLADRLVSAADAETLQRNLVHHLATGLDAPLPWAQARAVALARLCSIARGFSGASPALADLLVALLASPFAPLVPSKGTVGASGDLTPLAHLALGLMGRAPFLDRAGATVAPEPFSPRWGVRP
jgi:tyrosine ammonia-lyase